MAQLHRSAAVSAYQPVNSRELSFGDLFVKSYLLDIHVRSDAVPLGGGQMPSHIVNKLEKALNRELIRDNGGITVYSRAIPQRDDQFDALGKAQNVKSGQLRRAVLLSDNCAIDTALGVDRAGRRAKGRLLFSPVVPAETDVIDALAQTPIFGRFPLPAFGEFEGGIAELARCFMVDVRDVDPRDRFSSLSDEAADELEAAWSAYLLRRGPLPSERNAQKVAERLVTTLPASADASEALAAAVGECLGVAWRMEGRAFRRLADAGSDVREALDELAVDLAEIAELASGAARLLARLRED